MANINKPNMTNLWASAGAIIAPSDSKVQQGWTAEIPPHQWENYVQNRQDNAIAYLFQHGLVQWDALTEYQAGTSFVQNAGLIWKALTTNTNITPVEGSDWTRFGFTLSEITTGYVAKTSDTGSAKMPTGTTAQRDPTPQVGWQRFNTTTGRPEVWNGTTWGSMGGGATGGGTDEIFYLNNQVVTTNYTVASGKNAGTFGAVTINDGVVVTVSDGSVWSIV